MRDTARLQFREPIDGTKKGRRAPGSPRRKKAGKVHTLKVDPRVMKAAKKVKKPGQRIKIISAVEVRVVNVRD